MLCALILYVSGGIYSLTSTSNDRFFEKLFMAVLFTLRVFARNLLRGSRPRIIFFYFIFYDWPGIRTQAFASNKPTHYVLDHGDFIFLILTLIHPYFHSMKPLSTHIPSLKYLSYSLILNNMYEDVVDFVSPYLNICIHETQKNYDSPTNTKILTRRLCVCSACCSVVFLYFFFLMLEQQLMVFSFLPKNVHFISKN